MDEITREKEHQMMKGKLNGLSFKIRSQLKGDKNENTNG